MIPNYNGVSEPRATSVRLLCDPARVAKKGAYQKYFCKGNQLY